VFYLHGAIVEGTKGAPESPIYGRYEYKSIVNVLKDRGYVVFSEIRQANMDARAYAFKIATQVDSLKKAGVKAEDITIVGASKGAVIAMLTSGLVKDKDVRYVLMAGCSENSKDVYGFNLYGDILSIYEKTDEIGQSCKMIRSGSQGIGRYKEIQINTGLKHGFIYRPLKEWTDPVFNWVERK
jgi:hypothetical protein